MIFSFGMTFLKKVSSLFRKYDLFIQEYDKVTLKWGELILFECFWESSLTNSFPEGRRWCLSGINGGKYYWYWRAEKLLVLAAVIITCISGQKYYLY